MEINRKPTLQLNKSRWEDRPSIQPNRRKITQSRGRNQNNEMAVQRGKNNALLLFTKECNALKDSNTEVYLLCKNKTEVFKYEFSN